MFDSSVPHDLRTTGARTEPIEPRSPPEFSSPQRDNRVSAANAGECEAADELPEKRDDAP